jgi:hypothetical protein
MDELDIKGKRYISSKRASQMTGYAKDYIGQLAREGKILGTRVGRAWYLDEESLLVHAKTDYSGVSFLQQDQTRLKQATVSNLSVFSKGIHDIPALPKTWSEIRYIEDDSSLLPNILSSANTNSSAQLEEDEIDTSKSVTDDKIEAIDELLEMAPDIVSSTSRPSILVQDMPSNLIAGATEDLEIDKRVPVKIVRSSEAKKPSAFDGMSLSHGYIASPYADNIEKTVQKMVSQKSARGNMTKVRRMRDVTPILLSVLAIVLVCVAVSGSVITSQITIRSDSRAQAASLVLSGQNFTFLFGDLIKRK